MSVVVMLNWLDMEGDEGVEVLEDKLYMIIILHSPSA